MLLLHAGRGGAMPDEEEGDASSVAAVFKGPTPRRERTSFWLSLQTLKSPEI